MSPKSEPRVIKVLVAEDNPFIAELLRQGINTGLRQRINLTGTARFEFDHAHDGAGALSKLEKRPYDLLLCDMNLPIHDGAEVIRRLRAVTRLAGLRILALSSTAELRDAALNAGADRFLQKPVPLATLIETIAELLSL